MIPGDCFFWIVLFVTFYRITLYFIDQIVYGIHIVANPPSREWNELIYIIAFVVPCEIAVKVIQKMRFNFWKLPRKLIFGCSCFVVLLLVIVVHLYHYDGEVNERVRDLRSILSALLIWGFIELLECVNKTVNKSGYCKMIFYSLVFVILYYTR